MSGGYISGGWGFVVAAYTVTIAVLTIYGLTLMARLRVETARALEEQKKQ
jgi:hypothetical protein